MAWIVHCHTIRVIYSRPSSNCFTILTNRNALCSLMSMTGKRSGTLHESEAGGVSMPSIVGGTDGGGTNAGAFAGVLLFMRKMRNA